MSIYYKDSLEMMLRDRIMCGIRDEKTTAGREGINICEDCNLDGIEGVGGGQQGNFTRGLNNPT